MSLTIFASMDPVMDFHEILKGTKVGSGLGTRLRQEQLDKGEQVIHNCDCCLVLLTLVGRGGYRVWSTFIQYHAHGHIHGMLLPFTMSVYYNCRIDQKLASFLPHLTVWSCLQLAQMPISQDLVIFVQTTDRQTDYFIPCACARGSARQALQLQCQIRDMYIAS